MNDLKIQSPTTSESSPSTADNAAPGLMSLPPELEKLPVEMKATIFQMMAGFFRSTTGPDPETARIVAQSEMHEETCRLEGYKESLKTRDRQNDRDHEFRKKKLNHDTLRNMVIASVCVIGIACGLFLLVVKKEQTLGSNILIASFLALLGGGKSLFQKDKD